MAKKRTKISKRKIILIATMLFIGSVLMCGYILTQTSRGRALLLRGIHKIERMLTDDKPHPAVIGDKNDARYASMFNDTNRLHLGIARQVGLKSPLKSRKEAKKAKSSLVEISSNSNYTIDQLTHSMPYLTSGAAELLDTIGKEFLAALESKGLEAHRIIVTSVLRTEEDVKRLRESGNINASSRSAHCHGTTFDITYIRYDHVGWQGEKADGETLTETLSEVLLKLKMENKCYVKYEINQRCFHITSRV